MTMAGSGNNTVKRTTENPTSLQKISEYTEIKGKDNSHTEIFYVSSLETKSLEARVNSSTSVSASNESLEVSNSVGLVVSVELESEISNLVSSLRDSKYSSGVSGSRVVENT